MSQIGSTSSAAASSLSQLLMTESRLEALLADARARADTVVHEAEARGQARLKAAEAELLQAMETARSRHATECAERIAAIERETDAAVRNYNEVAASRAETLARWVADQVLAGVVEGAARA